MPPRSAAPTTVSGAPTFAVRVCEAPSASKVSSSVSIVRFSTLTSTMTRPSYPSISLRSVPPPSSVVYEVSTRTGSSSLSSRGSKVCSVDSTPSAEPFIMRAFRAVMLPSSVIEICTACSALRGSLGPLPSSCDALVALATGAEATVIAKVSATAAGAIRDGRLRRARREVCARARRVEVTSDSPGLDWRYGDFRRRSLSPDQTAALRLERSDGRELDDSMPSTEAQPIPWVR